MEGERALEVLQANDEERVASSLSTAAGSPESEISISTITALFEALSFHTLLDDADVNKTLELALLMLSQHHDLALADGGRYPGLYRLLAHDNQKLRLLVSFSSNRNGTECKIIHYYCKIFIITEN